MKKGVKPVLLSIVKLFRDDYIQAAVPAPSGAAAAGPGLWVVTA